MKKPKKPAANGSGSDYEVGYGKPPRHTRFQPGRSGNPRGRPKDTKNLKTDLIEELAESGQTFAEVAAERSGESEPEGDAPRVEPDSEREEASP